MSLELNDIQRYSIDELAKLKDLAEEYIGSSDMVICKWLYRNKSQKYFDQIINNNKGWMNTMKKDNGQDARSPINGCLKGLFFCASVEPGSMDSTPRKQSPFGRRRIVINIEELANDKNLYFADFYCLKKMNTRKDICHYVILVMTTENSIADKFCRQFLFKLDWVSNKFLSKSFSQYKVTIKKKFLVNVFYTEDINITRLINGGMASMTDVKNFYHRQRGIKNKPKNTRCEICNLKYIYKSNNSRRATNRDAERLTQEYNNILLKRKNSRVFYKRKKYMKTCETNFNWCEITVSTPETTQTTVTNCSWDTLPKSKAEFSCEIFSSDQTFDHIIEKTPIEPGIDNTTYSSMSKSNEVLICDIFTSYRPNENIFKTAPKETGITDCMYSSSKLDGLMICSISPLNQENKNMINTTPTANCVNNSTLASSKFKEVLKCDISQSDQTNENAIKTLPREAIIRKSVHALSKYNGILKCSISPSDKTNENIIKITTKENPIRNSMNANFKSDKVLSCSASYCVQTDGNIIKTAPKETDISNSMYSSSKFNGVSKCNIPPSDQTNENITKITPKETPIRNSMYANFKSDKVLSCSASSSAQTDENIIKTAPKETDISNSMYSLSKFNGISKYNIPLSDQTNENLIKTSPSETCLRKSMFTSSKFNGVSKCSISPSVQTTEDIIITTPKETANRNTMYARSSKSDGVLISSVSPAQTSGNITKTAPIKTGINNSKNLKSNTIGAYICENHSDDQTTNSLLHRPSDNISNLKSLSNDHAPKRIIESIPSTMKNTNVCMFPIEEEVSIVNTSIKVIETSASSDRCAFFRTRNEVFIVKSYSDYQRQKSNCTIL